MIFCALHPPFTGIRPKKVPPLEAVEIFKSWSAGGLFRRAEIVPIGVENKALLRGLGNFGVCQGPGKRGDEKHMVRVTQAEYN